MTAETATAFSSITEIVATPEQLHAIVGEPSELAKAKDIGRLDEHCRAFIAHSPFALLGTASAAGFCDVSPRGDVPGFARVLDEHTLALPERPGNRRTDSLGNIIENPQVGLLFFVPGVEETLRVNGRACITTQANLRATMAVGGKAPRLAIVVEVREAFLHCAKAFRRSRLWDASRHLPRETLPSLGRILRDQLGVEDCSVEELDARLETGYRTTLY
ncbi:MAG TPA: pyridoxamine 5'-phosphate oxidase family protein [Dehalococcoidia bacterium]|nr:pyridoxamine 5'-phosphate oxidase family protein [Dehalococcoidia bacterium]